MSMYTRLLDSSIHTRSTYSPICANSTQHSLPHSNIQHNAHACSHNCIHPPRYGLRRLAQTAITSRRHNTMASKSLHQRRQPPLRSSSPQSTHPLMQLTMIYKHFVTTSQAETLINKDRGHMFIQKSKDKGKAGKNHSRQNIQKRQPHQSKTNAQFFYY